MLRLPIIFLLSNPYNCRSCISHEFLLLLFPVEPILMLVSLMNYVPCVMLACCLQLCQVPLLICCQRSIRYAAADQHNAKLDGGAKQKQGHKHRTRTLSASLVEHHKPGSSTLLGELIRSNIKQASCNCRARIPLPLITLSSV
jgi:hypothetical protein